MGTVVNVGWAIVVCASIAAFCFLFYLLFLSFVIKTEGTAGLPDVAKAIRAFRVPLAGRRRK